MSTVKGGRELFVEKLIAFGKNDYAALSINYSQEDRLLRNWEGSLQVIGDFLSQREYKGESVAYTQEMLTVPAEVEEALLDFGVSGLMMLGNEIFARKGYVFTNPNLNLIYQAAQWYKPDSKVTILNSEVNKIASINAEFISSIEGSYDYSQVSTWLSNKEYSADSEIYSSENYYKVPINVKIS